MRNYEDLKRLLSTSKLFTPAEAHKIARTAGAATLGSAIIACELAGIKLEGEDIDTLIKLAGEIKYRE